MVPGRVGVAADGDGDGKVFHEYGEGSEPARENEIEEGPKLFQVVL
jgi:hypothetical protein